MYRATPHSTTAEAPATLLFNRQMRVRLPEITITQQPADLADRDSYKKSIMKKDAEARIKLKPDGISVGDTVLVRQDGLVTKQMMPYRTEPHEVIAKKGNMITAASTNGSVTRNISRFKRIDDLVERFGRHPLSLEQPQPGYEEVPVPDPPPEQYHVIESPVQPVAAYTPVAVPDPPTDLPDP